MKKHGQAGYGGNGQVSPDGHTLPVYPVSLMRFFRSIYKFAVSEGGWKARWLFLGLISFLFLINGMNVLNSYVGRDFMTAIADRNKTAFVQQTLFYLGIFAGCTLLSVTSRFMEERLALLWRTFLTRQAVNSYLSDGSYYHLDASKTLSNPDQRIAEDARSFTSTTLSFVLMMMNSGFTVVAFAGVLWSISPLLFVVAVLYALCGSFLTILLGKPLVGYNSDQLDREADFRSGLIHVRENAEAILLAGCEKRLAARLHQRLSLVVSNLRRIIGINRNLGFFTTGYNWMIQIIPALIIAPAFMEGKVEFGVVTQSAMAFSTLVAAFSLIISQFGSISSFAAVVKRLNLLAQTLEESKRGVDSSLTLRKEDGRIAYEGLSLRSPASGEALIRTLTVSIPPAGRVLIQAENESASLALFNATAGIEVLGEGIVVRPQRESVSFLAERPYLPPGTLRQALVQADMEGQVSDHKIIDLLTEWELAGVLARAGGLHAEQNWADVLSLGDQQLLACIRAILASPRFVVFDRPGTALSDGRVRDVLTRFSKASIGYLQFGYVHGTEGLYDVMVEIREDGSWSQHEK